MKNQMMWHPDILGPLTSLMKAEEITLNLLKNSIENMREHGRSCTEIAQVLKVAKVKLNSFAPNPKDALLMQAMLKDYTNVVKVLCKFSINNIDDLNKAFEYASLYKPAMSRDDMKKIIKETGYPVLDRVGLSISAQYLPPNATIKMNIIGKKSDNLGFCEQNTSNKMIDLVLETGDTRLHEAARKGDYIKLQEYIDQGDNINTPNIIGDTALHVALLVPDIQLVTSARCPQEAKR
ncbi:hypothetical protein [Candidatus Tisiphia endosymbiont of Nemotelus uliginosus]|uniref:hypothetical protein n=1 Tax=Candidatus Tisiphia endosymbiont of Nemotelus uliginosus TaxID=3077926 RepID=UPI0035C8B27C